MVTKFCMSWTCTNLLCSLGLWQDKRAYWKSTKNSEYRPIWKVYNHTTQSGKQRSNNHYTTITQAENTPEYLRLFTSTNLSTVAKVVYPCPLPSEYLCFTLFKNNNKGMHTLTNWNGIWVNGSCSLSFSDDIAASHDLSNGNLDTTNPFFSNSTRVLCVGTLDVSGYGIITKSLQTKDLLTGLPRFNVDDTDLVRERHLDVPIEVLVEPTERERWWCNLLFWSVGKRLEISDLNGDVAWVVGLLWGWLEDNDASRCISASVKDCKAFKASAARWIDVALLFERSPVSNE